MVYQNILYFVRMKNILILLFLPIAGICQQKHDNTIIAHGVSFDSAVNRLLDLGYKIHKIDKDFKTAETNSIKYDTYIFIREKNGDLIINGEIRSMDLTIPIEYGWGSKKRWQTLMEFAEPFRNLEYANMPGHGAAGG